MNNAKRTVTLLVIIYMAGEVAAARPAYMKGPKIVGGFRVSIDNIPFLLSVHTRTHGFHCGATIIAPSWGLSALHCLPDRPVRSYYVRAGSSIKLYGGTTHTVQKLYAYDGKFFDGKSIPKHDIVLFKVAPNFRFSNTVKPAKLPTAGSIPPKLLQVSGWGRTGMSNEGFVMPMSAHAANVSRIPRSVCIQATDWYESAVKPHGHLCYGGGKSDACYGDSGGPLADSNTVYGVVSFGEDCGVVPGVYADVSFYRRWIKRITNV